MYLSSISNAFLLMDSEDGHMEIPNYVTVILFCFLRITMQTESLLIACNSICATESQFGKKKNKWIDEFFPHREEKPNISKQSNSGRR